MKRILKAFDPLIGKPCWNVHFDGNTGLWLQFGDPSLHVREPRESSGPSERIREHFSYRLVTVRGEWTLVVNCGRWTLDLRERRAATNRSPYKRITTSIARLEGQRLASVAIAPDTARTVLSFDLGAVLEIRGSECDDGDLWTLYRPLGLGLSVRASGEYSAGRTSRDDVWRRLPRAAT